MCQTCADVVEEARPRKHTYVCSKERTVMRCAVLTRMEVSCRCQIAPLGAGGLSVISGLD